MAIGAFGIADHFMGGLADSITEGEKLRLQQNADARAQESHAEELQKAKRENEFANDWKNASGGGTALPGTGTTPTATSGTAPGASSNLVYNGSSFPEGSEYNPDTTNTSTANFAPGARAAIVAELRAKGVPDSGIAAIFANVNDESGFNPALRHPDQPKWGGEAHYAHGLYQEGAQEWNNYDAWLKQNGHTDWTDPALQTRFLAENLQKNYPQVWDALKNGTAEQGAQAFVRGYLRPAQQFQDERASRYARGVPGLDAYGPLQGAQQSQPSMDGPTSQEDAFTQAVTPRVQTASLNNGTATDASPAGAPTSSDGQPKFINPDGTPKGGALPGPTPTQEDTLTQALAGQPTQPAKQKPLGPDEVLVTDPLTGIVHRVPKSDTREKTEVEKLADKRWIYEKHGDLGTYYKDLKSAADAQVYQSGLDADKVARDLSANQGDPGAFQATANAAAKKVGSHLEVAPETRNGPDGPVTVWKVNPKGTNGAPMYFDRNGVLTNKPDLDPGAYRAGTLAIQSQLTNTPKLLYDEQVFKGNVQQQRAAQQQADQAAAAAPYKLENEKLAAKNTQSEIDFRKANTGHINAQTGEILSGNAKFQAAQKEYDKKVEEGIKAENILPTDKDRAAKVAAVKKAVQDDNPNLMALINQHAPVAPQNDFYTPGGVSAPTAGAPAAAGNVRVPNPGLAPPAAAGALPFTPSIPMAKQHQLFTHLNQTAVAGAPAPYDDSNTGRISAALQSYGRSVVNSSAAGEKEWGDRDWQRNSGPAYRNLSAALAGNKQPDRSDVLALSHSLQMFPHLADNVSPQVLAYVTKWAGR